MIVITGASDGLGLEVANLYKAAGKTVVNVSRHKSAAASKNVLHNLREGSEIEAAVKEILAVDEPLEAIINCAGALSVEPFGSITEDEIKRMMATNVKAPALLVSGLMERIKQDGTDIVIVTSTSGTKGMPDQPMYGASKWAARGLTESLQLELKNSPSRVINFCPGGMKTKLFTKSNTGDDMTTDGTTWMDPADVALCLKQLLDLPKSIEVSEIILNRKNVK